MIETFQHLAVMPFPDIDPVALKLGPLSIKWYGLAYVAGILLGWFYARKIVTTPRLWRNGEPAMKLIDIDDFVFWAAIGIVLGGPYNSGILARGPSADAQYNYSSAPADVIDKVRRINMICERHGVRLIEAALNFPLLHPAVVSVIPGGQSVAEVRSNRAVLGASIPAALWAELKTEGLMRPDAPC